VPSVLKSGSLDLLEPSGPVQGCTGIAVAVRCKPPLVLILQASAWPQTPTSRGPRSQWVFTHPLFHVWYNLISKFVVSVFINRRCKTLSFEQVSLQLGCTLSYIGVWLSLTYPQCMIAVLAYRPQTAVNVTVNGCTLVTSRRLVSSEKCDRVVAVRNWTTSNWSLSFFHKVWPGDRTWWAPVWRLHLECIWGLWGGMGYCVGDGRTAAVCIARPQSACSI